MRESVVVLGMNVLSFARSAVNAGHDVTVVGLLTYRDILSRSRYLSLARDFGGIFPPNIDSLHKRIGQAALAQSGNLAAYSGGFENQFDVIADLEQKFELLGNRSDALRRVRDPFLLQEIVNKAGLKMPEILSPGTTPDPKLEWLRKAVKSGAGARIKPWKKVVPNDPNYIIQQKIDGPPQSVSFVANGKEARIFAYTEQIIGDKAFGASGYHYVGNLLLPQLDQWLIEKLSRLANDLTRAFGLVGLNGIDFILHEGEPYILEVNPRYSASMEIYEDARGKSIFDWHIAGSRGEPLPDIPTLPGTDVYGKASVGSRRHGVLGDTTSWLEEGYRNVLSESTLIIPHFPLALVTAVGRNRDECYEQLVSKANALTARAPQPHGRATLELFRSFLAKKFSKGNSYLSS